MEPFIVNSGQGKTFALGGGAVEVVGLPESTGIGGFSVETFPPGFASPQHTHHRDGGVFYMLEGRIRVKCGELDQLASAGSTIFLPPGVPHAFRVEGDSLARWFNVQAPYGDFIARAMGEPFRDAVGAEPMEILGPFPE